MKINLGARFISVNSAILAGLMITLAATAQGQTVQADQQKIQQNEQELAAQQAQLTAEDQKIAANKAAIAAAEGQAQNRRVVVMV